MSVVMHVGCGIWGAYLVCEDDSVADIFADEILKSPGGLGFDTWAARGGNLPDKVTVKTLTHGVMDTYKKRLAKSRNERDDLFYYLARAGYAVDDEGFTQAPPNATFY